MGFTEFRGWRLPMTEAADRPKILPVAVDGRPGGQAGLGAKSTVTLVNPSEPSMLSSM
jgi:hypothetical protein